MSRINKYQCDSCRITKDAVEGQLTDNAPPPGWASIHDIDSSDLIAHICVVCRETLFTISLRETPTGKAIESNRKGHE